MLDQNNIHLIFDILYKYSKRSTCLRRQVAAGLVSEDGQIVIKGVNRQPLECIPCNSDTCERTRYNIPSGEKLDRCRAIHAEQLLILRTMIKPVPDIQTHTLFVTTSPCVTCAKLLIEFGITKIFYVEKYPNELAFSLLEEAGVEVIHISSYVKQ